VSALKVISDRAATVIGEILWAESTVEILVFASPTGYMFDILQLSFTELGYIP
jgi:hypothetical protein